MAILSECATIHELSDFMLPCGVTQSPSWPAAIFQVGNLKEAARAASFKRGCLPLTAVGNSIGEIRPEPSVAHPERCHSFHQGFLYFSFGSNVIRYSPDEDGSTNSMIKLPRPWKWA